MHGGELWETSVISMLRNFTAFCYTAFLFQCPASSSPVRENVVVIKALKSAGYSVMLCWFHFRFQYRFLFHRTQQIGNV
jgi:hypothetical protein